MNKFWQVVSRKDLIFGLIILALVILISIFRPFQNVKPIFETDAVDIRSTLFSMNIPYDMVSGLELVDMPELGYNLDGYNNRVIQTGAWHNETWGDYHACLDLASETCVVVHLNDGRIFVISRRDRESTEEFFTEFQSHVK